MQKDFILVPWQNDFLESILEYLANHQDTQDLSSFLILLPHERPQLYIEHRLQSDHRFTRPLALPEYATISRFIADIRCALFSDQPLTISQLDKVGLLMECVEKLPQTSALLLPKTDKVSAAQEFFPWGMRLASLFDECYTHTITPQDFMYAEDSTTPYAATLLTNLGALFTSYTAALRNNSWTTSGLDAFLVAEYIQEHGSLPAQTLQKLHINKSAQRNVVLAGFFALSGAEKIILRYLWEHCSAQIFMHTDTKMQHWSCKPLHDWIQQWRAQTVTIMSNKQPFDAIKFTAGFDLHSQLASIQKELQNSSFDTPDSSPISPTSSSIGSPTVLPDSIENVQRVANAASVTVPSASISFGTTATSKAAMQATLTPETDPVHPPKVPLEQNTQHNRAQFAADTAIILPDSGLLMPILHHLPATNINVSMGYPMDRSPLFTLLDSIFALHEKSRNNTFYWQDCIDLIRHPYIKMLSVHPATLKNATPRADDDLTLRQGLHRFEQVIRRNEQPFIDPRSLMKNMYLADMALDDAGGGTMNTGTSIEELPAKELFVFLQKLYHIICKKFAQPTTTLAMARTLEKFCDFLLAHGAKLWKRFPIDAECLFRLYHSIIPELAESLLRDKEFSPEAMYALTRNLLFAERVPFEATPLVGLQVMGVLETRLLSFRHVIIPECTEDLLPGIAHGDPLLPEPLRLELGLPSQKTRETVAAYHFYRLLAGAENVHLLWQESTEGTGSFESKKQPSRFVQELLWNQEKKMQRLLTKSGTDGPLTTLESTVHPLNRVRHNAPNTLAIQQCVHSLFKKPVSATLLDSYLRCPMRFYLEHVLRITSADILREEYDPLYVGQAIHNTLYSFYSEKLHRPLPEGEHLADTFLHQLIECFHNTPDYRHIKEKMPADTFAMFKNAGELRLSMYLENQPATTIVALEKDIAVPYSFNTGVTLKDIILFGRADRMDIRDNILYVLDYKTGRIPEYRDTVWDNESLWDSMESWTPATPKEKDPIFAITHFLESVQLPFYSFLLSLQNSDALQKLLPGADFLNDSKPFISINAAWVPLAADGKEKLLFTNVDDIEYCNKITSQRLPVLVSFLLRHMLTVQNFYPIEGVHCQWCPHAGRCIAKAYNV